MGGYGAIRFVLKYPRNFRLQLYSHSHLQPRASGRFFCPTCQSVR
nr:hypothetical protein [Comamonas jiangduensis]